MTRKRTIAFTRTGETIAPILYATYGKGSMTTALVEYLARRIEEYDGEEDARGGREYMIMRVCWDWMTGGSTADAVATQIEAALHA